ncbi:hypothetical protein [Thalassoroseus pseudoceratinae]|uniref:hypothetical protein n=1 Tax=Thalassoroseus pseudoceratinae TaxID=2713176 RepID=UPI0014207828|nr:hypothetical protein [Thalassoroseus pseudoceratinae]
MSRRSSFLERLMAVDMTIPLAAGVLACCLAGFYGGPRLAFQVLIYGVLVVFVVGMPLLIVFGSHANKQHLRRLQKTYGGEFPWSRFLFGPIFKFTYRDRPVSLRKFSGGKHGPTLLQVSIEWNDAPQPFTIRPQGMFDSIFKLVGKHDVQIGRAGFDNAYCIHAEDPSEIRQLLDKNVQRRILDIPEQKRLVIRLHRGEFLVRAQHYSLTSDLEEFTEAALRLFDAFERSALHL